MYYNNGYIQTSRTATKIYFSFGNLKLKYLHTITNPLPTFSVMCLLHARFYDNVHLSHPFRNYFTKFNVIRILMNESSHYILRSDIKIHINI